MKKIPNEVVNVSPDMQFYNLLESFPYDFTKAISEYIDNALQAFLDAKEKNDILEILIEFHNKSEPKIIITDNGVGIAKKDFQNALKPAKAKEIPSLSEFGIGMKAASIWFGREWELISSPYGTNESYKMNFNLDELILKNEEIVVLETIPRKSNSGVTITLNKLRREISKTRVELAWEKLQETYQLFTHSKVPLLKLSIKYNGVTLAPNTELITYRQPAILNFPQVKMYKGKYYAVGYSREWTTDISFSFDGHLVTGKLLVLEKSSQKDNPGIRLYRNNRLMKGFTSDPYRPPKLVGTANKHAPSRIFAELHLDGQAVSNNKSDFLFDEYYFIAELEKQPNVIELIAQAENYRARIEEDKIIHISEVDFAELIKKKASTKPKSDTKPKKAVLKLLRNADNATVGEQVDLLHEYIDVAQRSDGKDIDYEDINITVNSKSHENILAVNKCIEYKVCFSFNDPKTGEVSSKLVIKGIEESINVNTNKRYLIPHKANITYQLNIRPSLNELVIQINKLYEHDSANYEELIACSLRSCFELSIKAILESANIKYNKHEKELENRVYSIHKLMTDKKVLEKVCTHTSVPSYQNFLNEWQSITVADLKAYISITHLGAHGSTDSITPDRIKGMGNYLGLFLLAVDQLLNNQELQVHINNTIPILVLPK